MALLRDLEKEKGGDVKAAPASRQILGEESKTSNALGFLKIRFCCVFGLKMVFKRLFKDFYLFFSGLCFGTS